MVGINIHGRDYVVGLQHVNIGDWESKDDNYVEAEFLAYATKSFDKKGRPEKKKQSDPTKNFQLLDNPHPGETYIILVRFYEVMPKFIEFFKRPENKIKKDEAPTRRNQIVKNVIYKFLKEAEIKIWSSVPFFHWGGCNYNLSLKGGSIYPTRIAPKKPELKYVDGKMKHVRGWAEKNAGGLVDKITHGILNEMGFFAPQIAQAIISKEKARVNQAEKDKPKKKEEPKLKAKPEVKTNPSIKKAKEPTPPSGFTGPSSIPSRAATAPKAPKNTEGGEPSK